MSSRVTVGADSASATTDFRASNPAKHLVSAINNQALKAHMSIYAGNSKIANAAATQRFFNKSDFDNCPNCKIKQGTIQVRNRRVYHSIQHPGMEWEPVGGNPNNRRIIELLRAGANVRLVTAEDMRSKEHDLNDMRNLDITPNPIEMREQFPRAGGSRRPNPPNGAAVLPLMAAWLGHAVVDVNATPLRSVMEDLARLSTSLSGFRSDARRLVLRFVDRFAEGQGGEFSDSVLDSIVSRDVGVIRYAESFTSLLEASIRRNTVSGSTDNLRGLIAHPEFNQLASGGAIFSNRDLEFQNELENNTSFPIFNSPANKLEDGTFFMIHGIHGIIVNVLDYIFCDICRNYTGTLQVNIHDIFGLDQDDVERYAVPRGILIPDGHWGVYGWYALQHYKGFDNSKYNPFITRAKAEYKIGIGGVNFSHLMMERAFG